MSPVHLCPDPTARSNAGSDSDQDVTPKKSWEGGRCTFDGVMAGVKYIKITVGTAYREY